ncbi:carbon-nitrogen hydrolase family protein [Alloiococcus sp. CFN-8]|uniref:carbon-nitrogen hydrolase family protein n=1 Tax=Alloiococcus sp. CFN-8 TaxID=3416081 RepID=UPI003CE8F1C8
MKLGIIQMEITTDKENNMKKALSEIRSLSEKGADIVILPEMFNCPYNMNFFSQYAEPSEGKCWSLLAKAAKENNIYLIAGSIPEIDDQGNIYNTSYIFDRNGLEIGKHRKIHLFDINVQGGQRFMESAVLTAGDKVTIFDSEFCRIGVAICYDYRFPELTRLMVDQGAKIIIIPAAFNMTTGPAHWELLFRQRAVDNQVFSIGVAPSRDYNASYVSYGNSIVVSPWGEVLLRLGEEEASVVIDIDLAMVDKVRAELPLLKHRRHDLYKLIDNKNP